MSSVEEITALREELARKQAERKKAEADGVANQRQAELDREKEKLLAQIAEEEQVAQLLAEAGQNPEASATVGAVRSDEEVLAAHDAAVAAVTGGEVASEPAKVEEAPKTETAPRLTTGTQTGSNVPSGTASGAAATEQEK